MIGKKTQQFSGIVQRIYDEWHMIGNHTWDHTNLLWLSTREVSTEIQKTQKMIKRITWYTPIIARPPYGAQNGKILQILGKYHLASLQWSLDSNDWEIHSGEALIQRIMDNTHPGSIILMHDTMTGTIQTMSEIIDTLQDSGYTIVTVAELLWGPKHIHAGTIYRKQ
jgi:peptidoglycan/xylan/chitin deacetylase (PgdA/CDA1 family)